MYRHQLRFVLRFGVRAEFDDLVARLGALECARGWAAPRIWHSVNVRVNEIVIEHEYDSADVFRAERVDFYADPGEVAAVLARLAELAVPATAFQRELDEIEAASASNS